jgi:single-stranded-DNA-specific exonuclease
MVPLVGANRSITKFGLEALRRTKRVGLLAILKDAGASQDQISSYVVSHMITPRLNALGRLEHALDALRLLCTKNKERAEELASKLGLTNKERQKMTFDSSTHAKQEVVKIHGKIVSKQILLIAHESYNQGIIGLVAGKLVEEYYLPSIVLSKGEEFSKASARSIVGFNIVEAIRSFQELLIDVGGHPLAAGFTIETKNIPLLQEKLEAYAELHITEAMLHKPLMIDVEMPLSSATEALWEQLRGFEPFGLGNYEPIFVTREVSIVEVRQIGADGKHLKLKVQQKDESRTINAVAFSMGNLYSSFKSEQPVALAYTIDMNEWNGRRNLQLKIRDIQFS